MFREASILSIIAFSAVCVFVVGCLFYGVWISAVRESQDPFHRLCPVLFGVIAWIGAVSVIVWSGWLENRPMPRVLLFFGMVNAVSLYVGFSQVGKWLAHGVPIAWLVAFQGFRLPLEAILHGWVRDGVIPRSMTWDGSNWDVISGALALLLAPLVRVFRGAAWIANIVGIVLLTNVARVAVLSSPLPFGWPVKPSLQLLFHLPYAWILPIWVGGSLIGHVALSRALIVRYP